MLANKHGYDVCVCDKGNLGKQMFMCYGNPTGASLI